MSTATFKGALRAVMGAVWDDVLVGNGGGGIFSDNEVRRIGLDKVNAFPYAILQVPEESAEGTATLDDAWEVDVSLYRVQASVKDADAMDDALDAMVSYLRGNQLSVGEIVYPRGMRKRSDSGLDLNMKATEDGLQLLAGRVVITCRNFV
jgi:hypothetical protein